MAGTAAGQPVVGGRVIDGGNNQAAQWLRDEGESGRGGGLMKPSTMMKVVTLLLLLQ